MLTFDCLLVSLTFALSSAARIQERALVTQAMK